MAGHLLFNSGSNESSLAPQFKWLDNTFNDGRGGGGGGRGAKSYYREKAWPSINHSIVNAL
jgi:hypothetical protein